MPPRRAISQYAQRRWPRAAAVATGVGIGARMAGYKGVNPQAYVAGKAIGLAVNSTINRLRSKKKPTTVHQNAKLQVAGHGAGGTFTNVYIKKRLSKFMKNLNKNSSSNFSYVNASQRLTASSGNQYYLTMSSSFNATDLATMFQSTNPTCRTLVESVTQNDHPT